MPEKMSMLKTLSEVGRSIIVFLFIVALLCTVIGFLEPEIERHPNELAIVLVIWGSALAITVRDFYQRRRRRNGGHSSDSTEQKVRETGQ